MLLPLSPGVWASAVPPDSFTPWPWPVVFLARLAAGATGALSALASTGRAIGLARIHLIARGRAAALRAARLLAGTAL